ncbi:hypothetical protein CLOP_g16463 [Closterium sp. NIES-67]|nr:hypothetical protein CLOP_g16463 [Closterium sp. NIES-67]
MASVRVCVDHHSPLDDPSTPRHLIDDSLSPSQIIRKKLEDVDTRVLEGKLRTPRHAAAALRRPMPAVRRDARIRAPIRRRHASSTITHIIALVDVPVRVAAASNPNAHRLARTATGAPCGRAATPAASQSSTQRAARRSRDAARSTDADPSSATAAAGDRRVGGTQRAAAAAASTRGVGAP